MRAKIYKRTDTNRIGGDGKLEDEEEEKRGN